MKAEPEEDGAEDELEEAPQTAPVQVTWAAACSCTGNAEPLAQHQQNVH